MGKVKAKIFPELLTMSLMPNHNNLNNSFDSFNSFETMIDCNTQIYI